MENSTIIFRKLNTAKHFFSSFIQDTLQKHFQSAILDRDKAYRTACCYRGSLNIVQTINGSNQWMIVEINESGTRGALKRSKVLEFPETDDCGRVDTLPWKIPAG